MAKSENNEVMFGARGRVGSLVIFKNYYGRTIISKIQRKRENAVYTPDQVMVKERFKEGVIYAKGVLQDPILYDFYKPRAKGGTTVFNLALADFCKPPEITNIGTAGYGGNVGDKLIISASDNFGVAAVTVAILRDNGSVIESGPAQMLPKSTNWVYTCSVGNESLVGTVIVAKAADTPGNVTMLEQAITA